MIRVLDEPLALRVPPMTKQALRSKMTVVDQTFGPAHDDVLPLKWSIALLLTLAAASWAAIWFVVSLVL